jgi:hypothetical protein
MMLKPPCTKAEAEKRRYNEWAGNPKGTAYNPGHCAYEIRERHSRFPHFIQCQRKAVAGPDTLFCAQHARIVSRSFCMPDTEEKMTQALPISQPKIRNTHVKVLAEMLGYGMEQATQLYESLPVEEKNAYNAFLAGYRIATRFVAKAITEVYNGDLSSQLETYVLAKINTRGNV